MARLFDDGSTESLTVNSAMISATPLAMACWFNSNDIAVHQCLMSIADKDSDNDFFRLLAYDSGDSNYLQGYSFNNPSSGGAVTSSRYSVDTWHHACAIFASATDRRVLIDGGSKGTNANNVTPANLDRTCIGKGAVQTGRFYVSGMVAEAAIWDLSAWPGATDADKATNFEKIVLSLAAGMAPSFYPLGLTSYWPLIRGLNDKTGGYNLTANGTVVANQSRIIYPSGVL